MRCIPDVVPAATLLFPYFEVGSLREDKRTATVEIVNTSGQPTTVGITLWTQWAIPTKTIQTTISAHSTITVDLADLLHRGLVPRRGCGGVPNATLTPQERHRLRRWHSGLKSHDGRAATYLPRGEDGPILPRGYVTVDVHGRCARGVLPADGEYFGEGASRVVGFENILTGSYRRTDAAGRRAEHGSAVHLEAFPAEFPAGSATFYGSLIGKRASDKREPLPTRYSVELRASSPSEDVRLTIWRDIGFPHLLRPVDSGDFLPFGLPEWFTPNFGQGLRSRRTFRSESGTQVQEDPVPDFGCGLIPVACPPPAPAGLATQTIPALFAPVPGFYTYGLQMPVEAANVRFDLYPSVRSPSIPSHPPRLQGWLAVTSLPAGGPAVTTVATPTALACEPPE